MFDESAINRALGRVLRCQRRAWEANGVLQVEPLQSLQSGGQPDILITEPGRDPVIIEAEVSPARTVEKDATARLGDRTSAGDRIGTVIAVRLPVQSRSASSENALEALIESTPLEWAIWSDRSSKATRWPREEWVPGSVSLLAFAAYESTLAHHRVEVASQTLSRAVRAAGKKLGRMEDLGYANALHRIAETLVQTPSEQTWGMAALILANALVFHELLAGRDNLAHVPTPSMLRAQHRDLLRKHEVLSAWDQILDIDYLPIFTIARDILASIPDAFGDPILIELDSATIEAGLRVLLPLHDVLSETFQRLIVASKNLASFYTLPETAALLAGLALAPHRGLSGHPWHDANGLKGVVIADHACGRAFSCPSHLPRPGRR